MRYQAEIWYTYKITSSLPKEKFIIPFDNPEQRYEFLSQL